MITLGSTLYDPAVAVSKATSALLAMTAIDTTNLRLTVTVPAHGKLRIRMRCNSSGATAPPQILLGVLNGATVVGRVTPLTTVGTATSWNVHDADFIVTGLTPGSITLDAAYAVQIIVASTNIKFGGPNNATGNNAFGGFLFEIYDPQPIPTAAPGAQNGLWILGSNTGDCIINGATAAALTLNGTGNGEGLRCNGAGTGPGGNFRGAIGAGAAPGMVIQGLGSGGATPGLSISGGSGSPAVQFQGINGGDGLKIIAGNASGATPAGNSINLIGGNASTTSGGIAGSGMKITGGSGAATTNGAGEGVTVTGGGTTTVSGASGASFTGTGNLHGILTTGAGSGDGIHPVAGSSGVAIGEPRFVDLDATISSRAPASTAVSNADYTAARAVKLDNLDAAVSSRAPSATALSNADYTAARAVKLDNLDATISSRAPASTALSNADYTAGRAANLDNLDAAVSSRALAATAVSNADYTAARAVKLDFLDVAVSSRAAAVTAISNAILTNGRIANLDNLDTSVAGVGNTVVSGVNAILSAVSSVPSNVWGFIIEGSHTAADYMRGFASILFCKVGGMTSGASNPKFRDAADTKDRITATTDANGNRTNVTLNDLS